MKPFLVLQLRPEREASDDEFAAILRRGGLAEADAERVDLAAGPMPPVRLEDFSGIIVGGGPGCVSDPPEQKDPVEARIEAETLALMPRVLAADFPFMGCCYGIGILGQALGGQVSKARYGEPVSATPCRLTEAGRADPVLSGLPERFDVLVGHKEALQALPAGTVHLAAGERCPFQMIRAGGNVYATQFHPEADADSFALRIRIYRERGYFPPEDAQRLTEAVRAADVRHAGRILRNFVARYGG